MNKVLVALSGGLDSTTLLYYFVKKLGVDNVYAISMDYKQRHDIELYQAKKTCRRLGVKHHIVDMTWLYDIVSKTSSMVKNDIETPHDASEYMPSTYVPFRNLIISGILLSYAEAHNIDTVALGIMHEGLQDNATAVRYWDTTEEFAKAMQHLVDLNNKHRIHYVAPFVNFTKKDEIELGLKLGVPYEETWTCYAGKIDMDEQIFETEPMGGRIIKYRRHYQPCGQCPSCIGRLDAFKKLGINDPLMTYGVWEEYFS